MNEPTIRKVKLTDFAPDDHNPNRHTERGHWQLVESIRRFGAGRSGLLDRNGRIMAGNLTHEVLVAEGFEEAIVIETDGKVPVFVQRKDLDLDTPEGRGLAIADNVVQEHSLDWDVEALTWAREQGADLGAWWTAEELAAWGLDTTDPEGDAAGGEVEHRSLFDRFLIPPFLVLDARQGYWQERKRIWLSLGIQSELGRGDCITWTGDAVTEPGLNYYRNRGDGRGRSLARTFGQDLMKGENPKFGKQPVGRERGLVGGSGWDGTWVKKTLGEDYTGLSASSSGTSIFDPVLCELAYRWFCPPAGRVLDPFAGGSVRGIVAAALGRAYTGVDLRMEQVEANIAQAEAILPQLRPQDADREFVDVKVSAKSARLLFNGCDPEYIRDVCHAHCCESSTHPSGILVTIHPTEAEAIAARGGVIVDGLLQPRGGERRCPFKTDTNLCALHNTPDKPFGCIASPFTVNANGTLIVRNRYKFLKCYNDGKRQPAYKAFRASLDLLFGAEMAQKISDHLDNDGGDLTVPMPASNYQKLVDNDAIKHARAVGEVSSPEWMVGDSRDLSNLVKGAFDFIFTCPPYFDLELYSDDPADLSNAGDYAAFLADYRAIIAQAVEALADNRFACVVVGDIRDKDGHYRNFVSDTIAAFQDAGARLYNEAVLVTAVGSLPIRVGRQFGDYRKLGKTHQNVLVFVKGDWRAAAAACGPVDAREVLERVEMELEQYAPL